NYPKSLPILSIMPLNTRKRVVLRLRSIKTVRTIPSPFLSKIPVPAFPPRSKKNYFVVFIDRIFSKAKKWKVLDWDYIFVESLFVVWAEAYRLLGRFRAKAPHF